MANPTGVELHNGKIRITFTYRGVRCRETLKGWTVNNANIKKAGSLRAVIVSEIQLGTFDYAGRFPTSAAAKKFDSTRTASTWKELVEIWCESKRTDVSENTMTRINAQLKSIKKVVGEDTPIKNIQHSDVMAYRNEFLHGGTFWRPGLTKNRAGRKVSTVDGYMAVLCQILRFAYRSKFITDKPFEFVPRLQKDRKKPDPVSREEYTALLSATDGQDRNLWQFAIGSGLRHGELAALAWEDINLETGKVHVCRNYTRQGNFVPPKTKAGDRVITLLLPALEALRAQHALTGHLPASDIVFHGREHGFTETQTRHFVFVPGLRRRRTGLCFSNRSFYSAWRSAVKKSGIRSRAPRQTRHTYACWALTAGANPSFIASQLGHEDAQMVFKVYSAWIKDFDDEQVSLLNQRLTNAPITPPELKVV